MKVFLSYNRADASVAEAVAEDVRHLGYTVWYDREVSGGQAWWDSILNQIRACDLFLFIVTPKSIESEACMAESTYASELRKRVLPVLCHDGVRVNLLPPALSVIQFVDYRAQDKQAAFALVRALEGLPKPSDLPDPLPAEPRVPMSYLGGLRMQIVSDRDLSRAEQSALLVDIKQRLKDAESRQDALDLLRKLRGRTDVLASVAEEIDATLARCALDDERARAGAAGSGRSQEEAPTRHVPRQEPMTRAVTPQPDGSGIGRRLLRWALYGFLALLGLGIVAQMAQQGTIAPVPVGVLPQAGQLACCDFTGFKRCAVTVPLPLGSQCFCQGQGFGITCQ